MRRGDRALRRWGTEAAVAIGFAAAASLYLAPVWRDPSRLVVGVHGDPDEYVWFLGWFRYSIAGHGNPLLTDHLNFPAGVNLMWNTSAPLLGWIAAPVTSLAGPIAAVDVMMAAAMALGGWAASLAARRLGASRAAAVCAGLAFGFSPYMLAQSRAHVSTTFVVLLPVLVILVHEVTARQRLSPRLAGLLAGLAAGAQLLVLEEYVATGAVVLAMTAVAVAVICRRAIRERGPHVVRALPWAALGFAAVAAAPLLVQFLGPHRPGAAVPVHPGDAFVTDLANLVLPTRVEAFRPGLGRHLAARMTGDLYEQDGFAGLPLLLLCGVLAVAARRDRRVAVVSAVTAACILLSLGPRLHVGGQVPGVPLPWALAARLPLMNNVLPARLMVYADLGFALLIALFADRWVLRRGGRARLPAALLLTLVAVTWFPAWPAPSFPERVPPFFQTAAVKAIPAGSVALVAPFAREGDSLPMVWQAVAEMRFKMPEGYFLTTDAHGRPQVGTTPSPLSRRMIAIEDGTAAPPVGPQLRRTLLDEMRGLRIRTVVVGPMRRQAEMVAFFTGLLGSRPVERGGVYLWLGVGG